ncbi:MAG: FKBP-type peptidyl-prolyl cis-trans isomerase [Bacteroidales bacterium]|nr:FKBP-type peptidyl-prolyl cis-trans isomerase [Bacteroidales bacterium]
MKFKGTGIFLSILTGCILIGCSPFKGYDKADSGLYYRFFLSNEGPKPQVGQIVTVRMKYSALDSVYFDYSILSEPLNLVLNKPDFNGDINEALMMMSRGDSASFIIKADSFFLRTLKYTRLPAGIDEKSVVTLEVKVDRILSQEERDIEVEAWKNTLRDSEQKYIHEYIRISGLQFDSLPSGIFYNESVKGTSNPPQKGDKVTLYFSIKTISGKVLYSSWEKNKPYTIEFGRTFDTEGINIALAKMMEGTRANVIVPSNLAFGSEGRGEFVPPYSALVYDILVSDIKTPVEVVAEEKAKKTENIQKEASSIQKYLTENSIKAQPLPSGLIYIETVAGKGANALTGKKVSVHYEGKLLNGKIFDSSVERGKPFEFELGKGSVIKGWDEGVALMREGGKARLIIPSSLGYGERGAQPDIPPFAPLVFDIELIKVQ